MVPGKGTIVAARSSHSNFQPRRISAKPAALEGGIRFWIQHACQGSPARCAVVQASPGNLTYVREERLLACRKANEVDGQRPPIVAPEFGPFHWKTPNLAAAWSALEQHRPPFIPLRVQGTVTPFICSERFGPTDASKIDSLSFLLSEGSTAGLVRQQLECWSGLLFTAWLPHSTDRLVEERRPLIFKRPHEPLALLLENPESGRSTSRFEAPKRLLCTHFLLPTRPPIRRP